MRCGGLWWSVSNRGSGESYISTGATTYEPLSASDLVQDDVQHQHMTSSENGGYRRASDGFGSVLTADEVSSVADGDASTELLVANAHAVAAT